VSWATVGRAMAASQMLGIPRASEVPIKLGRFNVWSFNLRTEFCDEKDGVDGWSRRRGAVAELIRARRPALVCCQEATEAMLTFLATSLGPEEYGWVGTSRTPGQDDEMAGFLFDLRQLKLVKHCANWLRPAGSPDGVPSWDAAYPRTVEQILFELRLRVSGRPVLLRAVNTHLDHVGVEARSRSAEQLLASVERGAAEWPGCVQVMCGDFNSPKGGGNRVYQLLTSGAIGLRDAVHEARVRNLVRSTIHKFEGMEFSELHGDGSVDLSSALAEGPAAVIREDAQHIDWVLWRDGLGLRLLPVNCEVITDRTPSGRYPSDHFPVSVTFELEHSGTRSRSRL